MINRFIFDYLVSLFTPFNSCLILFDIDKVKIYEILCVGLVLDILFGKFIVCLFLLSLWLLFRKLNFKNNLLKNILIFVLYSLFIFIIGGFSLYYLVSTFVFMVFYFLYVKHIS